MKKIMLLVLLPFFMLCLSGCPETDTCEKNGLYGDGVCDDWCPKPDPDCDECELYGWYGDGECDEDCPKPDPDCGLSTTTTMQGGITTTIGGSTTTSEPGESSTTTTAGGGSGSTALQQGTYWEFIWNYRMNSTYSGGSDSESDFDFFKITLGTPVSIQGKQAYPLVITGRTAPNANIDFKPRWTHLASANGELLGSLDGSSLQPIFNPSKGSMSEGGFFIEFESENPATISTGTFNGEYNQLSCNRAYRGFSEGGCATYCVVYAKNGMCGAKETICSDGDNNTFSETEYFKDGVGPLGYVREIGKDIKGTGSNDPGMFISISYKVEVAGTSLTPADGSTIKPAPWKLVAPMKNPRRSHLAAVYKNKIYVFGGYTKSGDTLLMTRSVEIYDPDTDTWTEGKPISIDIYDGDVAATIGDWIYILPGSRNTVQIYDPEQKNEYWSLVTMEYSNRSAGGGVWSDATGTYIVIASPNDHINTDMSIYTFRPSDGALGRGTDLPRHIGGGAVTIVGNNLYVIGGFLPNFQEVSDETMQYDLATNTWYENVGKLNQYREMARAVTLNGEAVVLGGTSYAGDYRDVEAYSETTKTWRKLPPMLKATYHFAAVVLNGKIYVIGGKGKGGVGTTEVMVYTPSESVVPPTTTTISNTITTTIPGSTTTTSGGGGIGAACGTCAPGLTCITTPGGYCTKSCSSDAECGQGAYCYTVTEQGKEPQNLCLDACSTNADCRTGYTCQGDAGTTVCFPG